VLQAGHALSVRRRPASLQPPDPTTDEVTT